jgi:hypothetical protein
MRKFMQNYFVVFACDHYPSFNAIHQTNGNIFLVTVTKGRLLVSVTARPTADVMATNSLFVILML